MLLLLLLLHHLIGVLSIRHQFKAGSKQSARLRGLSDWVVGVGGAGSTARLLGDAGDEREGAVCDAVRAAAVDASLLVHVTAQARNASVHHKKAERKIEMANFATRKLKKKNLFIRVNNQHYLSAFYRTSAVKVICYSSARARAYH